MTEAYLAEQRLQWLTELAWAGGDRDLQRGWWPYCAAEIDRIDPQAKGRVISALKARRESA